MFDPAKDRCLELGDAVKEIPAPGKAAVDLFDRYVAATPGAFPGPDKGDYRKTARD